jgi:hypothetical protein
MALTIDELRRLVDSVNYRYFVDPTKPVLLCGAQGKSGRYQFMMMLEMEGRFLQFRTLHYHQCPANSPHLGAALNLLAQLNYQLRFVKFGWNAKDGEIVVYGDVWLMDAGLTQQQFSRVLGNYLPSIDENYPRIVQTVATGTDPGAKVEPDVERI